VEVEAEVETSDEDDFEEDEEENGKDKKANHQFVAFADALTVTMGAVKEFAELESTRVSLPQLLHQLQFGKGKMALAHSMEMAKPRVPLKEWNTFILGRGLAMRARAKEKERLAKEKTLAAREAQREHRQRQRDQNNSENDRAHEIYYAAVADEGGHEALTPAEREKMFNSARLVAMAEENQTSSRKRKRRSYFHPEF
jgi:hypothetical protein